MSGVIVGRYRPTGSVHVVRMEDRTPRSNGGMCAPIATWGMVRLMAWCGGDLPICWDVQVLSQADAREVVTCRNCIASAEQYTLPGTLAVAS